MGMSKTERTELRSLIRQQFRVLRAEVEQREYELIAEIEQQITSKYEADNTIWDTVMDEIHEVIRTCNKQVHDVLYRHELRAKDGSEQVLIGLARDLREKPTAREEQSLRRLAHTKVSAKVKTAQVDLDRREADLLRDLTIGALESDDAQKFLASIPTVGELVPTTRLAELEASLTDPLL